ncbi:MAG: ATP-binding protein [Lachnospiraceae bacterium]
MNSRVQEQKHLDELYEQNGNQIVVVYGRTDSQKETLLREFGKEKRSFYYRCRQASEQSQLAMMQNELEQQFDVKFLQQDYRTFFKRLKSRDGSKIVLIIDEFQYIAKKNEDFIKALIELKKRKLYPGPVMIVLATSAVSWVRTEFVEKFPELQKNITETMELSDLKFVDVVQYFPNYSVSECVQVYGVLGGVPGYLNRWDANADLKTNVCRHILSPNGFLFQEAEQFIAAQLRELANYDTILSAIAAGNHKLNALFQVTGFSRAKISVYMKNLMAFDVIEKVSSFETGGWENAQKGIYQIKNTFVNFWFCFVYPHLSALYTMEPEAFYDTYISPGLEEYMNRFFRQVCMEYLELLNLVGRLPIQIRKMGIWVGKKGNLDIVAQDKARNSVVGLCNWSEEEMPYELCEELEKRMEMAHITSEYRYFFSAKAFDPRLVEKAKTDKRYILVDMKQL